MPVILPMWITGFDKMMPEGRRFPFKFFPRIGTHLSVTFGTPLPSTEINALIDGIVRDTKIASDDREAVIRTEVTDMIRRAVEALGRSASGNSLRSEE